MTPRIVNAPSLEYETWDGGDWYARWNGDEFIHTESDGSESHPDKVLNYMKVSPVLYPRVLIGRYHLLRFRWINAPIPNLVQFSEAKDNVLTMRKALSE